jgi:hypothetical protein
MPGLGPSEDETGIRVAGHPELGLAQVEAAGGAVDERPALVRLGAILGRRQAEGERLPEQAFGGFVLGVVISLQAVEQGPFPPAGRSRRAARPAPPAAFARRQRGKGRRPMLARPAAGAADGRRPAAGVFMIRCRTCAGSMWSCPPTTLIVATNGAKSPLRTTIWCGPRRA